MVAVPVLVVAPAATVSVVPESVKSPATVGATAAADTVSETCADGAGSIVAVTVAVAPSPTGFGSTTSVTVRSATAVSGAVVSVPVPVCAAAVTPMATSVSAARSPVNASVSTASAALVRLAFDMRRPATAGVSVNWLGAMLVPYCAPASRTVSVAPFRSASLTVAGFGAVMLAPTAAVVSVTTEENQL